MDASLDSGIRLFTIGHSNRSWEDFLALLRGHGMEVVADVRRLPGSKKYPYFGGEILAQTLPEAGIRYEWLGELGGLRSTRKNPDSPNMGLTNTGFRSYADYMMSAEFRAGVTRLLTLAQSALTACMCAEAVFWKCHRRLLSDHLVAHGVEVMHILSHRSVSRHTLTKGAVVNAEGDVLYPPLIGP